MAVPYWQVRMCALRVSIDVWGLQTGEAGHGGNAWVQVPVGHAALSVSHSCIAPLVYSVISSRLRGTHQHLRVADAEVKAVLCKFWLYMTSAIQGFSGQMPRGASGQM